ncbi:hypothetical protein DFH08DRAFT_966333 [Mycena albidolilacea]|uniref:Uncharacterized protein n=1 Tax=Mycena albidolilacea TaxID=1033008 RepID=A0AAD6ZNU4_9AGAR|nr:hypothetical protein DFH08DRAFT_966333 [Mycena albidolilacea]
MIFILILVYLLSNNSSAGPVPHPLDARTSTDTCDDINKCRKLFDVVWGCLATIFACTWVSVHQNIGPPNQGSVALFWRRVKMMIIAIIAPEVMVGFAVRQALGARILSKEFKFSRTHGFFFGMGGFISSKGYPVATVEQLRDSVEFQRAIRNVNTEDMTEKSKGDALSKGVALAQGLWFTTQCLARVHQGLAVTKLEVATLGFAVVNIFIWALWWNKPLDVQQPIVIASPESPNAQPITPVGVRRSTSWNFITGYEPGDYDALSSTSVPSFWSLPMKQGIQFGSMVITALAGSVFGAIHCAAWNTDFPTTTQMTMWRSCSALITAAPVVIILSLALIAALYRIPRLATDTAWMSPLLIAPVGAFAIYIPARLVLIVLPFLELRSLPLSALEDIDWSRYIPHI